MTEKFENDWTRTVEKLRKEKAALLEACKAVADNCSVGETKDFVIPRWALEQVRAAIAQAENKEEV